MLGRRGAGGTEGDGGGTHPANAPRRGEEGLGRFSEQQQLNGAVGGMLRGIGDIIAVCHGKARLSKTRPLGLIPCVSGNEGLMARRCHRGGPAAQGRVRCSPPWPSSCWPLPWGNGDQFIGLHKMDFCLLSYFWAAELSALGCKAPEVEATRSF